MASFSERIVIPRSWEYVPLTLDLTLADTWLVRRQGRKRRKIQALFQELPFVGIMLVCV